jgi:hypothetical protein
MLALMVSFNSFACLKLVASEVPILAYVQKTYFKLQS